jgi:isochorismate pyruvate lyase
LHVPRPPLQSGSARVGAEAGRSGADQRTDPRDPRRDPRDPRQIDGLDRRIVALLAEREQFVRRAGRLKTDAGAVRAPQRVAQVVERVRSAATELGASPEVVERTYRAMIGAFIDLELASIGATGAPPIEPVRMEDAGELLTLQRAACCDAR